MNRKIIVDSETFWQIFQKLEGFRLADYTKDGIVEEKGYLKEIPIYIKND